jgi:hypothetical protein
MKTSILWRVASLVTIALALSSQGVAQPAETEKLGGGAAAHFGDQPFHGVVTEKR